jgi:hypothetical protein
MWVGVIPLKGRRGNGSDPVGAQGLRIKYKFIKFNEAKLHLLKACSSYYYDFSSIPQGLYKLSVEFCFITHSYYFIISISLLNGSNTSPNISNVNTPRRFSTSLSPKITGECL